MSEEQEDQKHITLHKWCRRCKTFQDAMDNRCGSCGFPLALKLRVGNQVYVLKKERGAYVSDTDQ